MKIVLTENLEEVLPPTFREFPIAEPVFVTEDEYWKMQIETGRVVEPLKNRCGDCAITTGYYVDHANSLMKQPEEVQAAVIERWFCHNNCNRGCKGVREYLQTK